MIKRHHPLYLETINLLTNGAFSRTSEFHQFVFSSINIDQVQSRYVVLRNFIEEEHNLIFFTDKRSPKVNAILKNSRTECLFYDNVKKIQLRIKTQSYILHDKKKDKRVLGKSSFSFKTILFNPIAPINSYKR